MELYHWDYPAETGKQKVTQEVCKVSRAAAEQGYVLQWCHTERSTVVLGWWLVSPGYPCQTAAVWAQLHGCRDSPVGLMCPWNRAWQCAPSTQHSPLPLTSWVTSGISCYKWTCNAGISLFSFLHKALRKCRVIIDKHYFYLFYNIFPTLGQMSTQHQLRLSTSQKFPLSLANLRQILHTSANLVCIMLKDD